MARYGFLTRFFSSSAEVSNLLMMQAKILRMSSNPKAAIQVIQNGLRPERPCGFAQADSLVSP